MKEGVDTIEEGVDSMSLATRVLLRRIGTHVCAAGNDLTETRGKRGRGETRKRVRYRKDKIKDTHRRTRGS